MENFLAQKRGEKALTRAQLAARVGASEADVARWEAGELPDSRCLLPLAEALGVEVEDILRAAGGEEASGNAGVAAEGGAEHAGEDALPEGRRQEPPVKEKLSTPVNGFTRAERVFGYIVCLLVLAAAVFVFVQRFAVGAELDEENYEDYLDLEAEEGLSGGVTITAASSVDIEDLSVVLEVQFFLPASFFEDRAERTLTLSKDFLAAGETVSGSVSMGGTYQFYSYRVISVGGKIA